LKKNLFFFTQAAQTAVDQFLVLRNFRGSKRFVVYGSIFPKVCLIEFSNVSNVSTRNSTKDFNMILEKIGLLPL
jgi:hypothetical protein